VLFYYICSLVGFDPRSWRVKCGKVVEEESVQAIVGHALSSIHFT